MDSIQWAVNQYLDHWLFALIGVLTTSIVVIGFLLRVTFWLLGISPIAFRLGSALWRRKIAIVTDSDGYSDLERLIVDSGVFRARQVVHLTPANLEMVKQYAVILIDYSKLQEDVFQIIERRADHNTAVVILAGPNSIEQDVMTTLVNLPNVVVVNSRGRLLNDLFTSMVTSPSS